MQYFCLKLRRLGVSKISNNNNMKIKESSKMLLLLLQIQCFSIDCKGSVKVKGRFHIGRRSCKKMQYKNNACVVNMAMTRNNKLNIWRNIKNDIV